MAEDPCGAGPGPGPCGAHPAPPRTPYGAPAFLNTVPDLSLPLGARARGPALAFLALVSGGGGAGCDFPPLPPDVPAAAIRLLGKRAVLTLPQYQGHHPRAEIRVEPAYEPSAGAVVWVARAYARGPVPDPVSFMQCFAQVMAQRFAATLREARPKIYLDASAVPFTVPFGLWQVFRKPWPPFAPVPIIGVKVAIRCPMELHRGPEHVSLVVLPGGSLTELGAMAGVRTLEIRDQTPQGHPEIAICGTQLRDLRTQVPIRASGCPWLTAPAGDQPWCSYELDGARCVRPAAPGGYPGRCMHHGGSPVVNRCLYASWLGPLHQCYRTTGDYTDPFCPAHADMDAQQDLGEGFRDFMAAMLLLNTQWRHTRQVPQCILAKILAAGILMPRTRYAMPEYMWSNIARAIPGGYSSLVVNMRPEQPSRELEPWMIKQAASCAAMGAREAAAPGHIRAVLLASRGDSDALRSCAILADPRPPVLTVEEITFWMGRLWAMDGAS